MPKGQVFVNAPPEQVFPAVSDLTRHAKWSSHGIEIEPVGSEAGQVGSEYRCIHKSKDGDRVTVTEISPDERFAFHVVMPNKFELDHTMTLTPQDGGTLLVHNANLSKLPGPMALFKPMLLAMIALTAGGPEGKFLKNLKAELEQNSQ